MEKNIATQMVCIINNRHILEDFGTDARIVNTLMCSRYSYINIVSVHEVHRVCTVIVTPKNLSLG